MTASAPFKPLSKNDVADVLGVSLRTLENWVNDGSLPAPAKLGNRCYWHPAVFYAWLERRLLGGGVTADAGAPDAPHAQTSVPEKANLEKSSARKGPSGNRVSALTRMRVKDQANLQSLMQ
jgi:predicted DNA-binding transcriptional regulator AlpA